MRKNTLERCVHMHNTVLNPNQDIKDAIKKSSAKKWQVANALGVAESTFNTWLHKQLSTEKKQEIMQAISKVDAEAKAVAKNAR
jgi:predicted XRE-type DNA-binding protein